MVPLYSGAFSRSYTLNFDLLPFCRPPTHCVTLCPDAGQQQRVAATSQPREQEWKQLTGRGAVQLCCEVSLVRSIKCIVHWWHFRLRVTFSGSEPILRQVASVHSKANSFMHSTSHPFSKYLLTSFKGSALFLPLHCPMQLLVTCGYWAQQSGSPKLQRATPGNYTVPHLSLLCP